jgi:hypothetical protein
MSAKEQEMNPIAEKKVSIEHNLNWGTAEQLDQQQQV